MFKKIFPLVFAAAAAHAAPAEAVEPTYVGEPTKKLARQAARCGQVMVIAGKLLSNRGSVASPLPFYEFAIETIGERETETLAGQQLESYRGLSLGPLIGRVGVDLENCSMNTSVYIIKNEVDQGMASCAGTAHAANHQKLPIGGDSIKIAWKLREAASYGLSDARHANAIAMAEFRALVQAGPSATQAAIQKCQSSFDAFNEEKKTNPKGGPAVSPTGPR